MPLIKIDEIEYNTEDLSDNGKAQIASLQFLERQLVRLRNEMAVYQTAQNSYISALKLEIKNSDMQPVKTDDLIENSQD